MIERSNRLFEILAERDSLRSKLAACEAERDAALACRIPFAEAYCAPVAAERDALRAHLEEAMEVLTYIAGLGDAGASDETSAALIVAPAREAVAAVLRGRG